MTVTRTRTPTPAAATTTTDATEAGRAERAALRVQAREETRRAADRWLTAGEITRIGEAMAVSITRYARVHGRQPTWADALAGVDPALLGPMSSVPADWPLAPAVWRRELRLRLMGGLKRTGWVTYTATPQSLRVGARGRGAPPGKGRPRGATPARSTPDSRSPDAAGSGAAGLMSHG